MPTYYVMIVFLGFFVMRNKTIRQNLPDFQTKGIMTVEHFGYFSNNQSW